MLDVEDLSQKLFVPNFIIPWYISKLELSDIEKIADLKLASLQESICKNSLEIEISTNSKIERIVSHSHELKSASFSEDFKDCSLELLHPENFLDKDFHLIYRTIDVNKPTMLVHQFSET